VQKKSFLLQDRSVKLLKNPGDFLAVPTPPKPNGTRLDLCGDVARQIAQHMDSYKLIVEKSTVPAETGKQIRRTIHLNLAKKYKNGTKSCWILMWHPILNFLKEGSAVYDFMNPDRIVIGWNLKSRTVAQRNI